MLFYKKFKEAERLGVKKDSWILENMRYAPNTKISQFMFQVNIVCFLNRVLLKNKTLDLQPFSYPMAHNRNSNHQVCVTSS